LLVMVNDILDYSHIEIGTLQLEEVAVDVRAMVEDLNSIFAGRALAKKIEYESSVADSVPAVIKADPLRLRQLLMNLLSNAIKFTESGSVRLEVLPAADPSVSRALLFRVVDSGIGIDPTAVDRLFRAFTQADSGSSRRYGGAGLGLAIAHRLVTLMGGSIGVESELGKGSTFWCLLPVQTLTAEVRPPEMEGAKPNSEAAPGTVAGVKPPAAPPKVGQGHVLIVEDNPINQIIAMRAVTGLGYLADVASSGEAAIEACSRRAFDVILMDCQMPVMDGYQAAREIRRREREAPAGSVWGRHTPIVAMTANAVVGDHERCLAAGMDDYLPKPVRIAALSRTLERWYKPTPRPIAGGSEPLSPKAIAS
jgi:CheY-like chemotaxis protein